MIDELINNKKSLFPVTIVMDAGIATEENIEYITSQ
jgi:transposase